MDDLLSDFLVETSDHIEGIATHLVLFEQNPSDAEALTQIYRLFHTIKGTAGFLGLSRLQTIAHAAETLISAMRDGAPPTVRAVSLLLQALDRIKALLAHTADLGQEPAGDDSGIIEAIGAYLAGDEPNENETPPAETPTEVKPPEPGNAATASADDPEPDETAPAQAAPAANAAPDGKAKAPETIRISVAAIQKMMDLVSELVLTRNQLVDLSRHHTLTQIKSPLERLSAVTSDLQHAVMRARMQPMTRLFASVPRQIRELSSELKKKFNLVIEGADTELDRQLIDMLRDPLMHLIRNCADHGIETPAGRAEAGKPEAGQILLAAFYEAGQVHIEITDDGRGLDAAKIRAKAAERGLAPAATVAAMSDDEVYNFILEPGFSTAQTVTTVSGRGIGMNVVRANIEEMGGTVSMQSSKGRGSKFILKIPLTLAIAPALIVRAADQRFAVPQQCTVEAADIDGDTNLKTIEDALLLQLRDELIPVVALSTVLQLPEKPGTASKSAVILSLRGQKFGLIVDEIEGIEEIVVKPLGTLLSALKLFSGNTILGDGSVILILDPAGIAAMMKLEKNAGNLLAKAEETARAPASTLILFKAGPGPGKVLPHSAVSRIMRLPRDKIEQADNYHLCRYQDKLIPIFPVAESCLNAESCLILVIALHGKAFGLCVDSVLDIIESTAEIQLMSNAPPLLGTVDLRGVAAEFIDTGHYYRMAFQQRLRPASRKGANILLVDREARVHDLLTPLLASAGYKVTAVETAGQANELMLHMNFAVILLDLDSAGALDQVALSRQPDALCLIFSDGAAEEGENAEDSNVISKFDRRRLLRAIAQHLDKSPAAGLLAANQNFAFSERNAN